jgi:hypothetical protein
MVTRRLLARLARCHDVIPDDAAGRRGAAWARCPESDRLDGSKPGRDIGALRSWLALKALA